MGSIPSISRSFVRRPRSARPRRRGERGHIIIMTTVCLLFIAGLAFFVMGVGKRYVQKETVQGAADAAAFAAAAAEAKVFNTVSFCNLTLSLGMAIVYTLDAVVGGLIAFILAVVALAIATLGTYCIGEPDVCAYVVRAGTLIPQYLDAADKMVDRLRPLEKASRRIAKRGGDFVVAEALLAGKHDAYSIPEPGLVVVTEPLLPKLPIEDGPNNTVCGSAAKQAEYAAAFLGELILRLPSDMPAIAKGLVLAGTTVSEPISAIARCEGSPLAPQQLKNEWRKHTKIGAASYQGNSRVNERRAYLQAAASQYSAASESPVNFVLATALGNVYGFDGEDSEDLWHMDWRGRLILSTPKAFSKIPLMSELKDLWVH